MIRRLRRVWHDLALSHAWRRDAWWIPADGHWHATDWHCACGRLAGSPDPWR
jgi:hypothetical protein